MTATTLLVSLVATPLLLKWLTQSRMGAFRASTDWAGYVSLLEFGLGGALLPMLAASMGRGDVHYARRILGVAICAYRRVALAMLPAGILLVAFIPALLRADSTIARDLRLGLAIGFLSIAFVPLTPLRPLLEGAQRSYIINTVLLAQSLLITLFSLVFAYIGWGITGQWIAVVLSGLFYNTVLVVVTWHRVPDMRRLLLHPSEAMASDTSSGTQGDPATQLAQLNWPSFVINITGRIGLMTDSVMLALFLGPLPVIPFQLTQRLAQTAQAQLQSVGNSTWAVLAHLHNNGEHDLFVKRLMELTRLCLILGIAAMGPIVAFDSYFVAKWVGPTQYGGDALNILAVVNGLMQALFSLWTWVFSGTGKIARLVPLYLTSGIINIAASAFYTKAIGLTGPVLGTCTAFVLINSWWLPMLLKQEFKVPFRSILAAVGIPLALGLPYCALLWVVAGRWHPQTYLTIAMGMSGGAVGFLSLAWLLLLSTDERVIWTERLAKFRRISQ